jgi:O-antigen ligase
VKSFCDTVVRWGLIPLLLFTPFAFGSVERWAQAITGWGIAILVLTFLLGRLWEHAPRQIASRLATGLDLPLALLVALVALQTVPLPSPLLRLLSPGAAQLGTLPDMALSIADVGGPPVPGLQEQLAPLSSRALRPISVEPYETFDRLVLLVSFVCLFYLIVGWCDRREHAFWLASVLTAIAALVAVIGLAQSFTWNERVLWFRRAPSSSYAFGPFINHNHFAAYVELIIPMAISLGLLLLERQSGTGVAPVHPAGTPSRFARADDPGGAWSRASSQAGLVLFAAVILVVSLFYSLSRGGILSAVLSGAVLLALSWKRLRSRRTAWALVVGLPATVLVIMGWIGVGIVRDRFVTQVGIENEASFRSRAVVWRAAAQHFPEFLWVGAGLGAFEDSFSPYTPPGSWARWDKAHNDYIQAAWELGLAGCALLAWAGIVFSRRYGWPALRQRGESVDFVRTGTALGLLSIALHSAVDFNLQIGANGALFAILAGMLVSMTRLSSAPPATATVAPGGGHD